MSQLTSNSTTTLVKRHDGHREGYLNCLVVRHGWTRTFSISPDELNHLDYTQLEKVLELNTLRLRPYMVRVYVEEPAGSGTYCKIRFWKDDGSLQSILVREFFERRCSTGGITTFELRDGRERAEEDDTESAFASKTSLALAKLRRKGSLLRRDASGTSTPTPLPTPSVRRTGTAKFFDLFRFPRSIVPEPPRHDMPMALHADNDDEEEEESEDLPLPRAADPEERALLQQRGWMPPVFRRVLGGATTPEPPVASSSSIKRRSKGKGRAEPTETIEPGEEDAHPFSDEDWEVQDPIPMDPLTQQKRPGIFARLNTRDKDDMGGVGKKEKNKNKSKKKKDGQGKNQQQQPLRSFSGAERISKPEDALPPPPAKSDGPSATTNPFDD
ncbi:hypothetical protein BKA62DRAFT_635536 [Auriculariales sp. MPI-PUGE-AT-0066]|nr:hypothetical protein BKA62DRAFT_635536 [Auriculariales sp. MPI-PUGE-AT-0066]